MLDIRWIRSNPKDLDEALLKRGLGPIAKHILDLDQKHRLIVSDLQKDQARKNQIAKEFQQYKKEGKDTAPLMKEGEIIKEKIEEFESLAYASEKELNDILFMLPNIPSHDCPMGSDETHNIEIKRIGSVRSFDFPVKAHDELFLNLMDFERASKLSGSRFVVLYGALSRLERALASWMLDVHTNEFGYTEAYVPLLTRDETMFGIGQLPKFQDDMFETKNGYFLIPTAEAVLTNLVAKEVLNEDILPLRLTAYTPCFRLEAGAAGKDTRGMIRQHQFGKVELVSITTPEQSTDEHERMTECAETLLKRLNLPYRVVSLCTGDLGFCSEKTYDLEVWLPSQQRFREISSCSRCSDFQARRMNARSRHDHKTRFVHTLNGSGLAVGRTLVAILENYQNDDGSVSIPDVLQTYMKCDRIDQA